ncbi:MAG: hypothetical protein HY684_07760 [Chloroflexi bacterium]|nr:hypothetical protein [Chloroflexota bacterium]
MTGELQVQVQAVELMNPVGEADQLDIGLAPRLITLNGKVAAIIDNGKEGANVFLAQVEKRLLERYNFAKVLRARKRRSSSKAPDLEKVAQEADFIIDGLAI